MNRQVSVKGRLPRSCIYAHTLYHRGNGRSRQGKIASRGINPVDEANSGGHEFAERTDTWLTFILSPTLLLAPVRLTAY